MACAFCRSKRDDLFQPRLEGGEIVGLPRLLPDLLRPRRDAGQLLDQFLAAA